MTLVYELPNEMPLGDVCGLVRHHPGQLILVAGRQYQTAVDGDEAPRHCKRVEDGVLHHEVVEAMLALLSVAREAVTDFLDVVFDLGVIENHAGLAHAAEPPQ